VQEHNESMGKKEEFKVQGYEKSIDKEEDYSALGWIPPLL